MVVAGSCTCLWQGNGSRASHGWQAPIIHCILRLVGFEALEPLLRRVLHLSDTILVVGPGGSNLHEKLYDR